MIAYLVLVVAAFATAMLSGLIGMGGGILLLATLFCFLSHAEAIPTHAAVQLASNSTRMAAFLRDVHWPTFGRFLAGALPGGAAGLALLVYVGPAEESEPYLKMAVGVYILVAAHLPRSGKHTAAGRWWDFPLMGLVAGMAALTVGAVGPLIAPLFARRDFVKERLVATKAACQILLHTVKIPAFLWLRSFDYDRLGLITLLMIAVVIPGTLAGKRLLRHVSEARFVTLYRIALTVAGVKVLVWDGAYAALTAG
jgi:uncharacterized membrane protein YfcA